MRMEGGQREKSEATVGWEKWERGRVLGTGPDDNCTHISEQPTAVYRKSAGQSPAEVLNWTKLCSASPTVSEFNSQNPRGKKTNSTAVLCPHTDTLRWASPLSQQEGSFKSAPLPLLRKPMSLHILQDELGAANDWAGRLCSSGELFGGEGLSVTCSLELAIQVLNKHLLN